jgi:hypothetical protein
MRFCRAPKAHAWQLDPAPQVDGDSHRKRRQEHEGCDPSPQQREAAHERGRHRQLQRDHDSRDRAARGAGKKPVARGSLGERPWIAQLREAGGGNVKPTANPTASTS